VSGRSASHSVLTEQEAGSVTKPTHWTGGWVSYKTNQNTVAAKRKCSAPLGNWTL